MPDALGAATSHKAPRPHDIESETRLRTARNEYHSPGPGPLETIPDSQTGRWALHSPARSLKPHYRSPQLPELLSQSPRPHPAPLVSPKHFHCPLDNTSQSLFLPAPDRPLPIECPS